MKNLKKQALEFKAWLESDDFKGIKKSSRQPMSKMYIG